MLDVWLMNLRELLDFFFQDWRRAYANEPGLRYLAYYFTAAIVVFGIAGPVGSKAKLAASSAALHYFYWKMNSPRQIFRRARIRYYVDTALDHFMPRVPLYGVFYRRYEHSGLMHCLDVLTRVLRLPITIFPANVMLWIVIVLYDPPSVPGGGSLASLLEDLGGWSIEQVAAAASLLVLFFLFSFNIKARARVRLEEERQVKALSALIKMRTPLQHLAYESALNVKQVAQDLDGVLLDTWCKRVGHSDRWEYSNGTIQWIEHHMPHFPRSHVRQRYKELSLLIDELVSCWEGAKAEALEPELYRVASVATRRLQSIGLSYPEPRETLKSHFLDPSALEEDIATFEQRIRIDWPRPEPDITEFPGWSHLDQDLDANNLKEGDREVVREFLVQYVVEFRQSVASHLATAQMSIMAADSATVKIWRLRRSSVRGRLAAGHVT